jgi:uncharacterized membrane protein YecN with MAPEG domain
MTAPLLLNVTLSTASVLGLIYVVLMLRIIRMRFRNRVSLGDGGNPEILKRVRAHGNFAEYVPLLLILMGLLELAGADKTSLAVAGVALVVFRIAHAVGMHMPAPNAARVAGTVGTFLLIIMFCGYGLWLSFN